MKINISISDVPGEAHQVTADSSDEYQNSQRVDYSENDPIMDAVDECDINQFHIIGVLVAIVAALLALPHAGGFFAGFGTVASVAFQVAGVVIGLICLVAGTYYGVKWAYRAYWGHRQTAVEFDIWKRQAELMASYGATGERPASAHRGLEFARVREMLPVNNQKRIERRTS